MGIVRKPANTGPERICPLANESLGRESVLRSVALTAREFWRIRLRFCFGDGPPNSGESGYDFALVMGPRILANPATSGESGYDFALVADPRILANPATFCEFGYFLRIRL